MISELTLTRLAKKTLEDIINRYGEIKFPIDPFRLYKDSNVLISF